MPPESRQQKRSQKREEDKLSRRVDGVTRKQLLDAEEELSLEAETAVASPGTTFSALLYDWVILEHQREAIRVKYHRMVELKKRGRKNDPDQSLTNYVQTKEEMEVIQEQIVEFLLTLDEDEIQRLLHSQHPIPGELVTLRVPTKLMDVLEKDIYRDEESKESEESKKDTEAQEVHGSSLSGAGGIPVE